MRLHVVYAFIQAVKNIMEQFSVDGQSGGAQLGLYLLVLDEVGHFFFEIVGQSGQLVLVDEHLLAGLMQRGRLVRNKPVLVVEFSQLFYSP